MAATKSETKSRNIRLFAFNRYGDANRTFEKGVIYTDVPETIALELLELRAGDTVVFQEVLALKEGDWVIPFSHGNPTAKPFRYTTLINASGLQSGLSRE